MAFSQDLFLAGDGAHVELDRVIEAARVPVGQCQVVDRHQGGRIEVAMDAFPVGEGALVQPDRVVEAGLVLVGGREVVP
ncbi:MAG TPA: hypothetical protein VMV17_10470 [Streptosporangiaceae bacterium]|nr:hypothetical protein [Streptosporangiaceae bacterium]